ncbi:MAG: hypothetical protein ACRDNK_21140 [Solirubrobacteraceae bacterium]
MSELTEAGLINWRELPPTQRRAWWETLWNETLALADRYRLALRAGWWQDSLQVEALAAFCAWLRLYDTGSYIDPPGKLQLLWELERLRAVIRGGEQAFDPARDRPAFQRHLDFIERSGGGLSSDHDNTAQDALRLTHQHLSNELGTVVERLTELRDREHVLKDSHDNAHLGRNERLGPAQRDLAELQRAIGQLQGRERELGCQLDELTDD